MERPLLAQEAEVPSSKHLQPAPRDNTAHGADAPTPIAVDLQQSDAVGTTPATTASADRTEINLIFFIIAFAAVDQTLAIPSLWPYMEQLGGSRLLYGVAGAVTNAVQIFSLPFCGWLSDKFSRKSILLAGQGIMAASGLLYGVAGTIGPGTTALAIVILSRMLVGFAMGTRSSAQSYLTTKSAPEDRSENLGFAQAVSRTGLFIGPAFNWFVVSLPEGVV